MKMDVHMYEIYGKLVTVFVHTCSSDRCASDSHHPTEILVKRKFMERVEMTACDRLMARTGVRFAFFREENYIICLNSSTSWDEVEPNFISAARFAERI
jgi:hypothetical protein